MLKASDIFYLDFQMEQIKGDTRFECLNKKCTYNKLDNIGDPIQLEVEGDMVKDMSSWIIMEM